MKSNFQEHVVCYMKAKFSSNKTKELNFLHKCAIETNGSMDKQYAISPHHSATRDVRIMNTFMNLKTQQ